MELQRAFIAPIQPFQFMIMFLTWINLNAMEFECGVLNLDGLATNFERMDTLLTNDTVSFVMNLI